MKTSLQAFPALLDYNVLCRTYANGMNEIRLYKKVLTKGTTREPPVSDCECFIEPFTGERVVCSKNVDGDGFTVSPDKRISQQKSMQRTINKIYDYAMSYDWEWFVTLTVSPDLVDDRADFDCVGKILTKWLNNMRIKHCPGMKYVMVPEKHKDGSYHFHCLFADCDELKFVPAINNKEFNKDGTPNKYFGKPLMRKGVQVYNLARWKRGFSECTKIRDTQKAAAYITKYITKDLVSDTPNKKRYWCSRGLPLPKERRLLGNWHDFDSFKTGIVLEFNRAFSNVHTQTVSLKHGDFENEIVYIHFSEPNELASDLMTGIGLEWSE